MKGVAYERLCFYIIVFIVLIFINSILASLDLDLSFFFYSDFYLFGVWAATYKNNVFGCSQDDCAFGIDITFCSDFLFYPGFGRMSV